MYLPGFTKRFTTILPVLVVIVLALQLSSCGALIKNYINKQYPPVSSLDKQAEAVRVSEAQLAALTQPDLGLVLEAPLLTRSFQAAFRQLYANDPTLGIKGLSRIEIIDSPSFAFGEQQIISSARLRFHVRDNKYVKRADIYFTGLTALSFSTDSLLADPSFQRIEVRNLKLRKFMVFSGAAKALINSLLRSFMDNINGQINKQVVRIDYPPLPELPLSKILGGQANLRVVRDDTFRIERKIIHPVMLIQPQKMVVLAQLSDKKVRGEGEQVPEPTRLPPPPYFVETGSGSVSTSSINRVRANSLYAGISREEFQRRYRVFDSGFFARWQDELDPQAEQDSNSVYLSYAFTGRVINELFQDAEFALRYRLDERTEFPAKRIALGDIPKPDCEGIRFECQFNNCNNVLSNCGSCRWYDAWCQTRRAACHVANGVKWAACQTSNGAKAVWCAAELVGRKGACYTALGLIWLYDNLIKEVGTFGGNAVASGEVEASVRRIVPNGMHSLAMEGQIAARADAAVRLQFRPSGLLGRLVCLFPMNETVPLNNIRVNQGYQLTANFQRITDEDKTVLRISMSQLALALQFSKPLLAELLSNPRLVLNCGIGIFFGTAIGSILALANVGEFRNYMQAALFGNYRFNLNEEFNVSLPSVGVHNAYLSQEFKPMWGKKSIVYH
jgi:hypothetical protein